MLVMKSTVAVYIHYKWHKFCLVNSQLAGAYTHSNHFGDSVVTPRSPFCTVPPQEYTKMYMCVLFCFVFIFVLNWPDALRHFFAEAAVERTPDSPPSKLCK